MQSLAELFWGKKSRLIYLLIAAAVLLLAFLGSRELWTQEHRWADIVSGMFFRQDFLHPYLNEVNYYDKPLLSYWLIVAFSLIKSELSTWTLRLPSALAGMVAIGSLYRLGAHLKDKRLGLLSGWMLLTTFYFVFWARTSNADMLNLAGSLLAVTWYFERKSNPNFLSYTIFFFILAITSLCKGLVGAIVPLLVILPDLLMKNEWKKHLKLSLFPALIPAIMVYIFPFWASSVVGSDGYQQNGLYLVYRENILRYVQPFDHKDPIYSYFIYLPLYLLPWTLFFLPAIFSLKSRWQNMSSQSKWMVWSLVILFLFFTFSGSRRNYYVLPMLPFAILLTADWILQKTNEMNQRNTWAGRLALIFLVILIFNFNVFQPWYYSQGGLSQFSMDLKAAAEKITPWSQWQFVMLDAESKSRFYIKLSPFVKNYPIKGKRQDQTEMTLRQMLPKLQHTNNTIFISRKQYEPFLKNILENYQVVEAQPTAGERFFHIQNNNAPVAFIPK